MTTFLIGRLSPVLVEAIKEQQLQISMQQEQIDELKKLVEKFLDFTCPTASCRRGFRILNHCGSPVFFLWHSVGKIFQFLEKSDCRNYLPTECHRETKECHRELLQIQNVLSG
jgi:hypothetical protein